MAIVDPNKSFPLYDLQLFNMSVDLESRNYDNSKVALALMVLFKRNEIKWPFIELDTI